MTTIHEILCSSGTAFEGLYGWTQMFVGGEVAPDDLRSILAVIPLMLGGLAILLGAVSAYRLMALRDTVEGIMRGTQRARRPFFGLTAGGQSDSEFRIKWSSVGDAIRRQYPRESAILKATSHKLTMLSLLREHITLRLRLFLATNLVLMCFCLLALQYDTVFSNLAYWAVIGSVIIFVVGLVAAVGLAFSLMPR